MKYNELGKFIKELRLEKGWTQEELAKKIPITREAISKWERGINTPDISSLNILAKVLNVTIDELLAEEKNTTKNVALELYKERNKINKKLKLLIFLTIFIMFLFLGYYFLNQYKSIKIYTISGKSSNFVLNNGLIIKTKEKIYFDLGNFENNNNQIKKMEIIYGDKILYTTNGNNILINDYYGYEEIFDFSKLNDIFQNLFVKIYFEDKVEIMKLVITRDYVNDNLIFNKYKNIKKNEENVLNDDTKIIDLIKNKFNKVNKDYILKKQDNDLYINAIFFSDTKIINLQILDNQNNLQKEYNYDLKYKLLDYVSKYGDYLTFNENCECISNNNENNTQSICNYFFEIIKNMLDLT